MNVYQVAWLSYFSPTDLEPEEIWEGFLCANALFLSREGAAQFVEKLAATEWEMWNTDPFPGVTWSEIEISQNTPPALQAAWSGHDASEFCARIILCEVR